MNTHGAFKVAICDLKEGGKRRAARSLGWVGACWLVCAMAGPAWAIECTQVKAGGASVSVCRADVRRDDMHVYLNDASGKPLRTFAALEQMLSTQGKRLLFAMNAGMFHADRAPVGLLVEQGREIAPLNMANAAGNFFLKPNGVFLVDKSGAAVLESSQVAARRADIVMATQSGPLLVIGGALHPRLSATSTSRFLRNGVGIDSNGAVVFAVTNDPQTLYEFATTFRDVLDCPNALYLDGTVTSIYAPALGETIQRADLGPIIAVVEPTTAQGK
jgi:uncharacterized protein YigE (DUF2233 family)